MLCLGRTSPSACLLRTPFYTSRNINKKSQPLHWTLATLESPTRLWLSSSQLSKMANTSTSPELDHDSAQITLPGPYTRLLRLDKPIGAWLLLWPCLWGLTLLPTPDTLSLLPSFALGSLFMRSAGCIANDIFDRKFDAQVERTKIRPIASGEISVARASALGISLLASSAGLAAILPLEALSLASLAVIPATLYPLAKRVFAWPQLALAFTYNLGAPIAAVASLASSTSPSSFVAFRGLASTPSPGLVHDTISLYTDALQNASVLLIDHAPQILPLYVAGVAWTMVYDTIYAHMDLKDDLKINRAAASSLPSSPTSPTKISLKLKIHSTAISWRGNSKRYMYMFSSVIASSLYLTGYTADLPAAYFAFATAAYVHSLWQVYSVRLEDRSSCQHKFNANVYLGLLVQLGLLSPLAMKLII